ncbi:MAG: hypothetical protein WD075_11120 [Rhodospirillales bacterium]
MRTDITQGSPTVATSAASAAFQVAVVQQKQFEETLERVSEKQIQAVKENIRKAERVDDVVDVNKAEKTLASNKTESSVSESSESSDPPVAESIGSKVNVSV